MSITTKKLTTAIKQYSSYNTDINAKIAVRSFIALYNTLGETELMDGIATAMQDEGYDEAYEGIICIFDEIDDIEESGE